MKKLLAIVVLLLLLPIASAQLYSSSGRGLFSGIFGRLDEAERVTERQMGEIIAHAERFGSGETNLILGPHCVHYTIGQTRAVQARYGRDLVKTDLTPQQLEMMVRKLAPEITSDLGNVRPTYRELVIC